MKDSGYLAGDVIHVTAIVTAPPGARLNRISLPTPGPISASLELRAIHATETQSGDLARLSIDADYQVFLATDHVAESEIPGYTVKFGTGEARIPAWSFHVSPLRVVQGTSGKLPDLKPDHALAPLPAGPVVTRLFAGLGVAAVSALSFAALRFRFGGFGRHKRPFACACRDIGRLRRAGAPIEDGFKALHHAYTLTAGHQLFAADLAAFAEANTNFAPLAQQTERFFAASYARFFARTTTGIWTWEELLALARKLRRAERIRA